MNLQRLMLMRSAARVQRMHVVSTHHRQTVGEHTFGVLAILFEIVDTHPSEELIKAVLYHDAPEAMTGDVPAPTKGRHPDLKAALVKAEAMIEATHDIAIELTRYEKDVLACCDLMELAMYAIEEVDMGNKTMASVMRNCMKALVRYEHDLLKTGNARNMYAFIKQRVDSYASDLGDDRLCGWTGP